MKKDVRLLGDEWIGWDGSSGMEKLDEPVSLFASLAAVAFSFFTLLLFVQWFLVKPRLDQVSVILSDLLLFLIITLFIAVLMLIFTVTIVLKRNMTPPGGVVGTCLLKVIRLLLPLSIKVGSIIGYSVDRMGNSFVKFHNGLTKAAHSTTGSNAAVGTVMVLMPRCIKKEQLELLKGLKKKYSFDYHVVGGGSAALKIIKEKKPAYLIGIACERDLLSGIADVDSSLPVIAIPNERPNGPCKNTFINLPALEDAISAFQ